MLKAMALLVAVGVGDAPRLPAVAVDMSQLDAPAFERLGALGLERKLVVRLLQEGFTVVPAAAKGSLLVTFTAGDERFIVAVGDWRESFVLPEPGDDRRPLHLLVIQKVTERALASERRPTPPESVEPPTRAEAVATDPPTSPATTEASHSSRHSVGIGAGVTWREATDLYVLLDGRFHLSGPFAVRGSVGWSPSSAADIRVMEWSAHVGVSWRQTLTGSMFIEGSMTFGGLMHQYWSEVVSQDAGLRPDWSARATVELGVSEIGPIEIVGWLAGNLTGRARRHVRSGELLWGRQAWGISGGAAFRWLLPR